MEIVCYFIVYELENMSCMIGCLYMTLVLWKLPDCLVRHVQIVSRA